MLSNHLTREELKVISVLTLLLALGLVAKVYRTSHPDVRPATQSQQP